MDKDTDDESFIKAAIAEYRALAAKELDQYNQIRGEYELEKLDAAFRTADSEISREAYDLDKRNIELVTNMRLQVGRLALDRYGRSSNALSSEELADIGEKLMSGSYAALNEMHPQHGGAVVDDPSLLACVTRVFPSNASKTDGAGVDDSSWGSVTKLGQSDCDWQFNYSGVRTRIDPDNADSTLLVSYYGNHTARHSSSSTGTRIIFGNWGVWFFCGSPNGVNVEMLN
jgi:hypothetical protein